MTEQERQELLEKSKSFFKDTIITSHHKNTIKLTDISEFTANPFLLKYLSKYAFGDTTPLSLAKALIYPRVLGTSISTTFGTSMQKYCSEVLSGNGSMISGMDIEFVDCIDNVRKYCQVKAGPQTINKDDVATICNHFVGARNLGRTNNINISNSNCVVGILYGEYNELSANYKAIEKQGYDVYIGKDFWHRLTGDIDFYDKLINTFADIATDIDGVHLLQDTVEKLAKTLSE